MADQHIQQMIDEWINCGTNRTQDLQLIKDESLFDAIVTVIERNRSDDESLDAICNKLYSYYRSNDDQLIHYCLAFIPPLIGVHILNANNCVSNASSRCRAV
ncbi:unnamed protein product, partial [Medioppia subpectinata]